MQHRSILMEGGLERQVELEIPLLALGDSARWLEAAPLGGGLAVEGFLAPRSRGGRALVLHVNTIDYLEGN